MKFLLINKNCFLVSFNLPDVGKINSLWRYVSDRLLQSLSGQEEVLLNKISPSKSWSMAQAGDYLLKSFDLDGILNSATERRTVILKKKWRLSGKYRETCEANEENY